MAKRRRTNRRRRYPQRGRRWNGKTRAAATKWAKEHGAAAAAAKFGMCERSVQLWLSAETARDAPLAAVPAARTEPANADARGAKGRRYGAAEKKEILDEAARDGVSATAAKRGVSRWSIYEWQRRQKGARTREQREQALRPRSSRPRHIAGKLSEERYHLIADTWLKNQALGPRQVSQLLRREQALRVGTTTVRHVLEEHGYVPPKIKVERRPAKRYEAVRPSQQWHFDFLHFFLHKKKIYLLLIEDDFSRFIVGWALCEGERAGPVLEAFDLAIARHGKPEQIVVDGGSGFFSWRGQSQLELACGDYGIDFIKASKRGSNSKLEALNANVRKELLSRVEFADVAEARLEIARWVRGYNFDRVHDGLGGLLVPADRFFGRVDEVLAQLERGDPVVVPGPLPPDARTLELFRVLSRAGRPELWLLGERVWPATASTTAPTPSE